MRTPTPSLVWPPLAVGDKPSQKTLRVANKALRSREIARDRARLRGMHCATALTARVVSQGPKDAEVVWSLHAPPDATWPIEAAVHTGAEGRLRLKVTPRRGERLDGAGDVAPFAISGGGSVIPAGEERSFHVSFAPEGDGPADAVLVARLSHPVAVTLPSGGTSRAHPDLALALHGDTLAPLLHMSEREKVKVKVRADDATRRDAIRDAI